MCKCIQYANVYVYVSPPVEVTPHTLLGGAWTRDTGSYTYIYINSYVYIYITYFRTLMNAKSGMSKGAGCPEVTWNMAMVQKCSNIWMVSMCNIFWGYDGVWTSFASIPWMIFEGYIYVLCSLVALLCFGGMVCIYVYIYMSIYVIC
jgi:hypothetical protein